MEIGQAPGSSFLSAVECFSEYGTAEFPKTSVVSLVLSLSILYLVYAALLLLERIEGELYRPRATS